MAKRWVLAALAALTVVAGALWIPWATKERVVTTTEVPPPLFSITPIPVKGGSDACLDNVTFTPQTEIGEIGMTTGGKPGPPLAISASASGYHATSRIPGGYRDDPAARFTIVPPARPVIGKLCIRNTGRTPISLNGTTELRTMGRPTVMVDGVLSQARAKLIFYDRVPSSYLSRIGQIFGHAAIFTPAFFSKGVLMALALLALLGIPTAMAAALAQAAKADTDDV